MIEPLLQDWKVPFDEKGNGWVNIQCPFCGDTGEHLGIAPNSLNFHCWRCGWHPTYDTLALVLNQPKKEIPRILQQYNLAIGKRSPKTERKVNIHPFKMPLDTGALSLYHKMYLRKRNFSPRKLVKEWGIVGTGPVSFLDKINYSYRIIIPIYWDGQVVSFQGRDISDKSTLKYLACPPAREIISHKDIIYGRQEYWENTRIGIICEGVFDAWRLGPTACATFGMEFSLNQVMTIARSFDRIFTLYDNERQAKKQSKSLASKLKMLGKEVISVHDIFGQHLEGYKDPGEMEQDDADALIRDILTKVW